MTPSTGELTGKPSDVVVALEAITARRPPLALAPITIALGPGAHAVVGAREDGGALLLDVMAGRARVRSGRVRVLGARASSTGAVLASELVGADPSRSGSVARAIAHVGRDVALPEALSVAEVLAVAAAVRGEPARDPSARLDALGIGALALRRASTLAPDEARAVAVGEALTSHARLVLLDEPYVGLDPRAAPRLAAAVHACAGAGACVVVATSSLHEAAELADDHLVLDRGALVRRATALDELANLARPARVRVVSSDARALVAALAKDPAVAAIEAADAVSIALVGADAVSLADAVAHAAVRAGVDVESLGLDAPGAGELRAARDHAAARRAAQAHAVAAPAPPVPDPGSAR